MRWSSVDKKKRPNWTTRAKNANIQQTGTYRGFPTRIINGVSLLYIMLEIHHSGWEPSICTCMHIRTHTFTYIYTHRTATDLCAYYVLVFSDAQKFKTVFEEAQAKVELLKQDGMFTAVNMSNVCFLHVQHTHTHTHSCRRTLFLCLSHSHTHTCSQAHFFSLS